MKVITTMICDMKEYWCGGEKTKGLSLEPKRWEGKMMEEGSLMEMGLERKGAYERWKLTERGKKDTGRKEASY